MEYSVRSTVPARPGPLQPLVQSLDGTVRGLSGDAGGGNGRGNRSICPGSWLRIGRVSGTVSWCGLGRYHREA